MKSIQLFAVLALFSTAVFAGYTQPAPVTLAMNPDGSGQAFGDMVTARFADNDVEMIGCGVRAYAFDGYPATYGFCQARDASGAQIMCTVYDSDLIDGIDSIGDFSFILFSWNAEGECETIGASTQSFYMPDFRDLGTGAPGSSGGRGR